MSPHRQSCAGEAAPPQDERVVNSGEKAPNIDDLLREDSGGGGEPLPASALFVFDETPFSTAAGMRSAGQSAGQSAAPGPPWWRGEGGGKGGNHRAMRSSTNGARGGGLSGGRGGGGPCGGGGCSI